MNTALVSHVNNCASVCVSDTCPCSQVAFGGSNCRRKADLLVSVEEDCIEVMTTAEEEREDAAGAEYVQVAPDHWEHRRQSSSSSTGSGRAATRTTTRRPKRRHKRRFLKFFNADGMVYHAPYCHSPSCPQATEDDVRVQREWREQRQRQEWLRLHPQEQGDLGGDDDDDDVRDDQHEIKLRYAECMTQVDPEHLVITWDQVSECRLAHHARPPDPSRWNTGVSGAGCGKRLAKHDAWHRYKSIRDYLEAEHPYDSCLGIKEKRFTQSELVAKIMDTPYNSEGGEFAGFCVIVGGREAEDLDDGVPAGAFGFCHQRSVVRESEIGEFTKLQVRLMHPGNPKAQAKLLKELGSRKRTVVRNSFPAEGGELISLDYLRFLIRHRGFHGFKVLHFVFYRGKQFTSTWIDDLIQQRHTLRTRNDLKMRLYLIILKVSGRCDGDSSSSSGDAHLSPLPPLSANLERFLWISSFPRDQVYSYSCSRRRVVEETLCGGGGDWPSPAQECTAQEEPASRHHDRRRL